MVNKEVTLTELIDKCSEILEIQKAELAIEVALKGEDAINILTMVYTLNSVLTKASEEQKPEKLQKPPIGLKPFYIHNLERIEEIHEAIARYYNDKKGVPTEWVAELQSLEAWAQDYENEKHNQRMEEFEKQNQVHIVVGKRGEGKTTELIKASNETKATIVCMNKEECSRIRQYALDNNLDIPSPITAKFAFSGNFKPDYIPNRTLLFDNIDCILNKMIGSAKLGAISITNYGE